MKFTSRITLVLLALALASPAYASFGHHHDDDSQPKSTKPDQDGMQDPSGSRGEAEKWYHDAYDDVQKAKSSLDAKKDKDAEKHFRRALERGQRATELDSTYAEAWNLVGYASRKLKDYDRALAAYQRCLKLKPDYAPAREYLGEAYLELGKVDLAKEQLAAIDASKDSEDARTLATAIDDWEKAHPDAGSAAPASTGGSSGGSSSGSH